MKIPQDDIEARVDFIKSKLRIYETSESEAQTNLASTLNQADDKKKDQGDNTSKKSNSGEFKSQLDFLYLIWKALDFEKMFETFNNE